MDFEFSITGHPVQPAAAALRTVYHVDADRTYDVRKRGVPFADVVALRTIRGLGKVTVEGQDEVDVTPGTLLFFEHNLVRWYYCAGDEWEFWWFEFSAADAMSLPMNRLMELQMVDREAEDCAAILELLGRANAGTARLASASFSLLLCRWISLIETGGHQRLHRRAVEDAINRMKANLQSPVPVGELAREAGLCERRFRQVFRQATGMQPKKYHEALRVGIAEELLRNTPLSIGEIAARLGYSSQFHFSRAFRQKHNMPPKEYRGGLG